MSGISKIVILAILICAAGYLWWQRSSLFVKPHAPVEISRAVTSIKPSPPILSDGSFNPIPTKPLPMNKYPETAVLKQWQKTEPGEAEAAAKKEPGNRFFVYPFLDLTRSSLGNTFTYAWHPLGMGALGAWSDAQLQPVANYDLLKWADNPSSQTSDTELLNALAKSIAANPELAKVDRVVTGIYRNGAKDNTARLTIYLLSPKDGKPALNLLETGEDGFRDFKALTLSQRNASRAFVEKLVSLGEVKAAEASISKKDLGKALAETANLLSISDIYAVEEGINSALNLARQAPDSPAPLQAAAFGYLELDSYWDLHGLNNLCNQDYALRAYALAQLAMTYDKGQELSILNWYGVNGSLGHDSWQAARNMDRSKIPKPLFGSWIVASEYRDNVDDNLLLSLPDWQRLFFEGKQRWSTNNSQERGFFDQCVASVPNRDLFNFMAYKNAFISSYDSESNGSFDQKVEVAHTMANAMLREEIAMSLCLLYADPQLQTEAGKCAADFAPLVGARAATLTDLAKAGSYYELCRAMRDDIVGSAAGNVRWGALEDPQCNYYQCLRQVHAIEPVIRNAAASRDCPDGIPGLSFSAWERWKLFNRLRSVGPALFCQFLEVWFGDRDMTNGVSLNYLQADPDDAQMMWEVALLLKRDMADANTINTVGNYLTSVRKSFTLNNSVYYEMGRYIYYTNKQEEGYALLRDSRRGDPFDEYRWFDLGSAFGRYKQYGRAIECYRRFVKIAPERWDAHIEIFNMLAAIGKPAPEAESVFQTAIAKLPGNSSFSTGYLSYLYYYKKDMQAVMNAANSLQSNSNARSEATGYKFSILLDEGKKAEAEQLADTLPFTYRSGLGLASEYVTRAYYYMRLDNLPKAEDALKKAWEHGNMKGDVMVATADLLEKQGKYDESMQMINRYSDRYPGTPRDDVVQISIKCLDKTGKAKEALEMLEKRALDNDADLMTTLAERYLASNEGAKIKGLVERAYQMNSRTPYGLGKLLDVYAKVDPADAASRKAGLNAFFKGPPLPEDMQ